MLRILGIRLAILSGVINGVRGLSPGLSRRAFGGGVGIMTGSQIANAAEVVDVSSIRSTKGGVKYVVKKEGSCPAADPLGLAGSCTPTQGSFCIVDYTGFLPSGAVFDSTESKGRKPVAFKLGEKQVIVGIEQLVSQMKPGEEVQALIPAELAYGEKGVCTDDAECLIPPNTDLKYFVRLVRTAAAAG